MTLTPVQEQALRTLARKYGELAQLAVMVEALPDESGWATSVHIRFASVNRECVRHLGEFLAAVDLLPPHLTKSPEN